MAKPRAATPTPKVTETKKPWEAAGVSRATWYRSKKAAFEVRTEGNFRVIDAKGVSPKEAVKRLMADETISRPKPKPAKVSPKADKSHETQETVPSPVSTSESNPKSTAVPPGLIPWQKGQSGNPGGRAKQDKSVKLLARQYTAEAIKTLAEVMRDTGAATSARVGAAQVLLDRGHGKPLQQLEVGEAGAFADLEEAELDAAIAKMGAQLALLTRDDDREHAVH
jgi:hypothetical protein